MKAKTKETRLGFLAIDEQSGEKIALTEPTHPRKQLLAKLGRKSASRMYCDLKSGGAKHIGWIVAGRWFRILQVCDWQGGKTQ